MTVPNVSKIIAFEEGQLDDNEVIELFGDLVKSGLAWQLQGSYGRMAVALINGGYLAEDGTVLAGIDHVPTDE